MILIVRPFDRLHFWFGVELEAPWCVGSKLRLKERECVSLVAQWIERRASKAVENICLEGRSRLCSPASSLLQSFRRLAVPVT